MNSRLARLTLPVIALITALSSVKTLAACEWPEARQFDFWIGDWEVKDHQGNTVGKNAIFPILDGCALSENWTSAAGNPGQSINFYDRAKKQWHQTWIDPTGAGLYLDGNLQDGKMVLEGTRPDKAGNSVKQRISWTPMPDGRVKQHWQTSKDGGQNWTTVFLGFYSKVSAN